LWPSRLAAASRKHLHQALPLLASLMCTWIGKLNLPFCLLLLSEQHGGMPTRHCDAEGADAACTTTEERTEYSCANSVTCGLVLLLLHVCNAVPLSRTVSTVHNHAFNAATPRPSDSERLSFPLLPLLSAATLRHHSLAWLNPIKTVSLHARLAALPPPPAPAAHQGQEVDGTGYARKETY